MKSLSGKIVPLLLLLWASCAMAAGQAPHALGNALNASVDAADDDDTPAPTIEEAPIAQPSIDGFGALEQEHGGLSPDIWKGSVRADSGALLQELRSGIASQPLRDLLMRLLMTQASPPAGDGQNWFIQRLNALIAIGLDDKADAMIASLPISMTSDAMRQMRAQLLLTRGEWDNACKLTPAAAPDPHAAADTNGIFWRKLAIVCESRAGKKDEAMVGLDMLREESGHDDTFFQEAIRRISDKAAILKSTPKEWSLFDAAMLHLTGDTALLKSHLDAFPPVAVKYLAQDPSLDAKLREKAVIRATQLGMLPVNPNNKTPEPPFEQSLASDVTTLVKALGSGKPANGGDASVIARLEVGDSAGIQDCRRVERMLSLMEPFGYTVPEAVWQKLFARKNRYDGDMPPAELLARLQDASIAGRKGDVILLSALILDGTEESHETDLALLPIVRALIAAGFTKEARQIAYNGVKDYASRW